MQSHSPILTSVILFAVATGAGMLLAVVAACRKLHGAVRPRRSAGGT